MAPSRQRSNSGEVHASAAAPWGIGGLGKNFALFGPGSLQDWVDPKLAPGTTDQRDQLGWKKTAASVSLEPCDD